MLLSMYEEDRTNHSFTLCSIQDWNFQIHSVFQILFLFSHTCYIERCFFNLQVAFVGGDNIERCLNM
jgi:hypothetical protein